MKHYNLTPKSLFSEDELKSVKDSLMTAKSNVDRAESLVMALNLTEFELKVLAQRLSNELIL